ncbi:MAG TPA: hypothetical protein VG649_13555 [Candidatus Angelobacter sp.]|nr:hypothetical protein [Candidatus Angelobacter sp.]
MESIEKLKGFIFRHALFLTIIALILLCWMLDRLYLNASVGSYLSRLIVTALRSVFAGQADGRVIILLPITTLFLAFANLYLKISVRAPDIQRRLRTGAFRSFPFAVYFGVYLLLAILAYIFLLGKVSNWFVGTILASIVGIAAANADIKFGGMSLQPLAEFLKALEAVVEAGISTNLNELDIAKRASLRDQLVRDVPKQRLEREYILLGLLQPDLQTLQSKAADDENIYKGLLSIEVIKKSEVNAWRLLAECSRSSSRYRIRCSKPN